MNDSENKKVKRNLTALVEFSRILNSSLDMNFILNNVLLTCMGKFLSTKGLIALNLGGRLVFKAGKGISEERQKNFPDIKADVNCLETEELKSYLESCHLHTAEYINSSNDFLGIVSLGDKLNNTPFTEDDVEFLKTILNIAASAIQNSMVVDELKKVNRKLDSRVQRLNALFELSKEFVTFSESTKVARLLVYSVIGQFLVSKFAVVTIEDNRIRVLDSKFEKDALLSALSNYNLGDIENSATGINLTGKYPKLEEIGIELLVPMQLQGETKGLILLGKRINRLKYNEADIEFIYSVGSLAIISLENRRLFKEALAKQKMEEELEIARDIQRNLLPHSVPQYSNFEIAASNLSSQQVGGDYYDLIELDENSFCVAIGDVSGKGVPAALLMANLQAFLKTICKQGMDLEEATALINDLVSENTSDGKFITFFWGVLDNESRKINYVNAGHNYPLLIRNGEIIKLNKGGIILGVMKTVFPYESESIQLLKDDVLVLFTDGVTEAKNTEDEEYSDEKLEQLALELSGSPAREILTGIQTDVKAFAKNTTQSDDITVITLKVK